MPWWCSSSSPNILQVFFISFCLIYRDWSSFRRRCGKRQMCLGRRDENFCVLEKKQFEVTCGDNSVLWEGWLSLWWTLPFGQDEYRHISEHLLYMWKEHYVVWTMNFGWDSKLRVFLVQCFKKRLGGKWWLIPAHVPQRKTHWTFLPMSILSMNNHQASD